MDTAYAPRAFAPETTADALAVIAAYLDGWPYSRSVDAALLDHWRRLRDAYQPEQMLIAYRDGAPRAFAHGERQGAHLHVHLLAVMPGAAAAGAWLLGELERRARAAGLARLRGPGARTGIFYAGYVCGLEPYHPHWAADGTAAFVRAGFHDSRPGVMLVMDLAAPLAPGEVPPGYAIAAIDAPPEFGARTLRYAALWQGEAAATAGARLYPALRAGNGGPVCQIGHVATREAHRGKGLARALVRRCLCDLRAWGATEALIATALDNTPALRAYAAVGFQQRYALQEWSKDLSPPGERFKGAMPCVEVE